MPQATNFLRNGPTISLDTRTMTPFPLQLRVVGLRNRSIFENMTMMAAEATETAGDLMGDLLTSAFPAENLGCEVLRPLWAEKSLHRAYSFIQLINRRSVLRTFARSQHIAARDLALRFRELETAEERAVLPCAAVLRDVVSCIGILFGRPANIELAIRTGSVRLPGYQRRALVLAAVELVNNGLLHGFPGHTGGRIEMGLTRHGEASARLSVADDGVGFRDLQPNLRCGVASGLAGLLEGDLAYDRVAGWTIAEITFPVARF